jgi:hypothetical protein
MQQGKRLFLFILLFVFSFSSFAEKKKKPNYKKIEKEIKKKKSDFYYPKLWEKFMDADPNMTLEEKRHLYYGYIFQADYSAYGRAEYSDSLRSLMKIDNPSDSILNQIVIIGDSVIKEQAFDVRARNYQLYALDKLGNTIEYEKKLTQMKIIVQAIMSSGDGLTKKTAFYVFSVSHEYFILSILGYDFGGSQSLIEHYDYLVVEKNKEGIKGFYFDISPSLNSLSDIFK